MGSYRSFARTAGAALVCLTVFAADAAAQMAWADRIFVNVNVGQQWMDQPLQVGDSFDLYEETATWDATVPVDDSFLFDVSGGYRVWKNLAFAIGFTNTSDTHESTVDAVIPDTLFFDAPHASSVEETGLKRSERGVLLSALWMVPVTDRIDVAVLAGPTFFTVTQAVPSGITVPTGGTTVASVSRTTIKESAVGYHIGVDGTARVLTYAGIDAGVGFMARYSSGKIDAPTVVGGSIDVGGFQGLVGLRFRY